jgi:hypothetical protein
LRCLAAGRAQWHSTSAVYVHFTELGIYRKPPRYQLSQAEA